MFSQYKQTGARPNGVEGEARKYTRRTAPSELDEDCFDYRRVNHLHISYSLYLILLLIQ